MESNAAVSFEVSTQVSLSKQMRIRDIRPSINPRIIMEKPPKTFGKHWI